MTEPPVLRIVAGGVPSDEEAAALVAVLTAVASAQAGTDEQVRPHSRWRDSASPAARGTRSAWLDDARQSALRRPR